MTKVENSKEGGCWQSIALRQGENGRKRVWGIERRQGEEKRGSYGNNEKMQNEKKEEIRAI